MFTLKRPSDHQLLTLIKRNKDTPFSYPAVGASRSGPVPPGYNVDRNRIRLGSGQEVFAKAQRALRSWAMFDLSWVSVFPRDVKIQAGALVAVIVSHFGFWSVNLSRIVYVEDPCSFANGTLAEHAESGEERFSITLNAIDGSVWCDVLAFSKPNHVLAKAGYPLSRMLQKRFARDSMAAMARRCR